MDDSAGKGSDLDLYKIFGILHAATFQFYVLQSEKIPTTKPLSLPPSSFPLEKFYSHGSLIIRSSWYMDQSRNALLTCYIAVQPIILM